ncbi:MAG TPA: N(4)-(beta-N-acetylglucosaminyl)-L-asparaginase [Anaerolineae bacterium]|nr:N(4)-(beta-N-acetylglucosaminyl)-L-asparaginase [Anaerolineae bacterium]HQK14855.1 N(4)-(beta-N-acetylglucosaminyl)-L-asparaginase [Anaerolineae bacterium]
MFIFTSQNGSVGIEAAMQVLRDGGSALDAVETGIRLVEANPDDHSVGYGGYPNLLGEVELDAAIMDGSNLTGGAVGALKGYPHPISVARKVLEKLPHVFLVGEGAMRFAAEMGFERRELLTEAARAVWEQRLREDLPPDVLAHLAEQSDLWRYVEIATDPERARGTTNFIAQDARGNLAVGVSTSGWAWKYPGRIGDSPIIGAGLYADNRYGAAACTGTGEMAIRAATAHSIVFYMKMGLSVIEAGQRAMADLNDLGGRYLSGMNFIAVDRAGNHVGFSSRPDVKYLYFADTMDAPAEVPRLHVPLKERWEKIDQQI